MLEKKDLESYLAIEEKAYEIGNYIMHGILPDWKDKYFSIDEISETDIIGSATYYGGYSSSGTEGIKFYTELLFMEDWKSFANEAITNWWELKDREEGQKELSIKNQELHKLEELKKK